MEATLSPAIIEALAIGSLPDVEWKHGDDLCDCVFQRIGMWKNPYLSTTQEIRLCCVWAKLGEQYPDLVRMTPGYFNENTQRYETEPWEWNGEAEMPKALWYRQLARKLDRPLADIRAEYSAKDELRPKGHVKPEPIPFILLMGGQEVMLDLAKVRFRG